VPGLVDAGLGLVGPHLAAPGVARERGKLGALDPLECFEREAGRVAAGIAVPAARVELGLHLPRANDDEVAAPDFDALALRRGIEVGAGDAIAVFQHLPAEGARHVEENAAADHPRLGLLDAALLRARRGHLAAIVAIPHGILVEHMAEAVPLRAALQRHHHHVVGGANAAMVEDTRVGIRPRAQHGMQGIDAAHGGILALRPLRAVLVEVERERDHLALAHEPRGRDDVPGRCVIERPDLVVGSPPAPVLVFFGRFGQVLAGELARGHHFFSWVRNHSMIVSPVQCTTPGFASTCR
jgi:hypothetical protein